MTDPATTLVQALAWLGAAFLLTIGYLFITLAGADRRGNGRR